MSDTEDEIERPPHIPVICDDRIVSLERREVEYAIMCSVCQSPLTHTRTSKECMHRFCAECVDRINRQNNASSKVTNVCCPLCRTPFRTHRVLCEDADMDRLVAALIGDPREYASREGLDDEAAMAKLRAEAQKRNEEFKRAALAAARQQLHAAADDSDSDSDARSARRERAARGRLNGGPPVAAGLKRTRSGGSAAAAHAEAEAGGASAPTPTPVETELLRADVVVQLLRHPNESVLPEMRISSLRMRGSVDLARLRAYAAARLHDCEAHDPAVRDRIQRDGSNLDLYFGVPLQPWKSKASAIKDLSMTMAHVYASEWPKCDTPVILLYRLGTGAAHSAASSSSRVSDGPRRAPTTGAAAVASATAPAPLDGGAASKVQKGFKPPRPAGVK